MRDVATKLAATLTKRCDAKETHMTPAHPQDDMKIYPISLTLHD